VENLGKAPGSGIAKIPIIQSELGIQGKGLRRTVDVVCFYIWYFDQLQSLRSSISAPLCSVSSFVAYTSLLVHDRRLSSQNGSLVCGIYGETFIYNERSPKDNGVHHEDDKGQPFE